MMKTSASVMTNLGAAAGSQPYTLGTKVVMYTPVTQKVKAKLEGMLTNKARMALKADKDFMSDEEYQLAFGAFHDRVVTGAYTFGSKLFKAWFQTSDGVGHMLEACTGTTCLEWQEIIVSNPTETAELIGLIMDVSFPNWRAAIKGE